MPLSEKRLAQIQLRERTWYLEVRLPAGLPNVGRFMARVLKYLLRTWGVRCIALRDGLPESRLET
jgi:hypothetical protein